jgi:hypothetical protein
VVFDTADPGVIKDILIDQNQPLMIQTTYLLATTIVGNQAHVKLTVEVCDEVKYVNGAKNHFMYKNKRGKKIHVENVNWFLPFSETCTLAVNSIKIKKNGVYENYSGSDVFFSFPTPLVSGI